MTVRFATLVLCMGMSSSAMAQDVTTLKPDAPTKIGDMEAVCTGVGLGARENPAWKAYPLKIEVAGRGGQYLGDIRATVSRDGKAIAAMTCDGPWILLKAAPGAYRVDITTEGQTTWSNAFVPSSGQGHIIIRFPMLGGEIGGPANQSAAPSTNLTHPS